MEQDIYEMKPPGVQSEDMIGEHIKRMHERPVVV
jgi:hypothetical protein